MSYTLIKEGIKLIPQIDNWESFLIKYDHKRNPNEFTCYNINFSDSSSLKDTIMDMSTVFFNVVDKKYNHNIQDYTGFNPKNTVDKLSTNNELITENWKSLIEHINISDDSTNINNIKANAYVFVGTYTDSTNTSQNLYILSRRNPILIFKKGGRSTIFAAMNNTISKIDKPLIQFDKCFDVLVYKNIMYMINSNFESIFNMEYTHNKICNKSLDLLQDSDIVDDISYFRDFATHGQNQKKFITYNKSIVKNLKQDTWKEKISEKLNIPLNSTTKKFELNNKTTAKNFILLICEKTKQNIFDADICEVPSSTPINLS